MLVKENVDTVFVKYNFKDSLNKVLILDIDLEPKTNYEIIIPDSVFWSVAMPPTILLLPNLLAKAKMIMEVLRLNWNIQKGKCNCKAIGR